MRAVSHPLGQRFKDLLALVNCVAHHTHRILGVMKQITNHDAGVAGGRPRAVRTGGYQLDEILETRPGGSAVRKQFEHAGEA